jgi:hypothetical protein
VYDSHPHKHLCMRDHLGNELPFPRHYVFPNPYLTFSLFIQPFMAFDFHLLIPFVRYAFIAWDLGLWPLSEVA